MNIKFGLISLAAIAASLTACSGGGGGGDGKVSLGGAGGDRWTVLAGVSKNGCGERIADVHQTFITSSGAINTSLATVPVTESGSGFEFSYSETSGDCTRTYTGHFSDVSGGVANVELVSDSTCAGQSCQNKWIGTATRG